MNHRTIVVLAVLLLCGACSSTGHESSAARATSNVPALDEATKSRYESALSAARAAYNADPAKEDNIVWLGRRLAYLRRYEEAIDVYSFGLKTHPESVKLLRHRGHRYITTRQFDRASKDLQHAADLIRTNHVPDEIESDGLPNARGIPLSTLYDNVYYHLALTRYLRGQFEKSAEAWRGGLERVKPNDDMLLAYTFWLYIAESRSGRPDRAAALLSGVAPGLDIIENFAYYRLLQVAKGELSEAQALEPSGVGVEGSSADRATILHGLGAFALIRGDLPAARARFEECLRTGEWPSFGYIASETELERMSRSRGAGAEPRRTNEILRDIQKERQRSPH